MVSTNIFSVNFERYGYKYLFILMNKVFLPR